MDLSAPGKVSLVAAEADAFPDGAADYLTRSWDRNLRQLAEVLVALADQGRLVVDPPDIAAEQSSGSSSAAP